jgi:hypothetical protein
MRAHVINDHEGIFDGLLQAPRVAAVSAQH